MNVSFEKSSQVFISLTKYGGESFIFYLLNTPHYIKSKETLGSRDVNFRRSNCAGWLPMEGEGGGRVPF
jgi:hypothetical protein